ncbi:MAG: 2-amino-4-hydroxy-6-hydroxymethyldihydropteridine diphosphokinase [Gammaproteobacteria bacterium]
MNNPATDTVTAYIGLGSNLDDPVEQIKSARSACAALPNVRELAFSSLYGSPPMGPHDQPDYVNAVMAVATTLSAIDLLHELQSIENQQGRVRTGRRWGARTLDLDLLIYGDQKIDRTELTVPHPGIANRAFVLYPLYEIAPDLVIPGKGPVSRLIANCPLHGLQRID